MANIWENPGFELGHVDEIKNGREIQRPEYYRLWIADRDQPNPYDEAEHSRYDVPEMRVLSRADIPDHEEPDFFTDGSHCFKVFQRYGTWWIRLIQFHDLSGWYRMTARCYADLIVEHVNGEKVPAPDAVTGQMMIEAGSDFRTDWLDLVALAKNELTLDFEADGPMAIAVNARCNFAIKNAGMFFDGWSLERIEEPAPIEGRGAPRVQYSRVYNVARQDVTRERWLEIAEMAYDGGLQTLGGSHDDAGIGDLDERRAVAWDVQSREEREELRAFFERWYPGVELVFDGGDPDPGPDPEPLAGPLLTVHVQTDVTGLPGFIAQAQPAWVKLVGNAELAQTIKQISPETQVLYRHHIDHQAPYLEHPDPAEAARSFLDRFWGAIEANPIDCVEGLNETIATGDTDGIMRAVAFEVALSSEVARRGDASACLLNTAIGNPAHGLETELLLPAAEAAVRNGHYIGYHPYFPARPGYTEQWLREEGLHHHLRALLSWDPVFTAAGYHVRYLFTEAGACGAAVRHDGRPGGYNFLAGWRHSQTLNADWQAYLGFLLDFQGQVTEWNAQNGDRARAIMLFTVGAPYVGWDEFKLWERELSALGETLS
jgi:hypothetical protein